ncbi:low molecular weight protein-tyrosine-phosphatase [Pistricoccus aurantiacus]|uniref:low molecular weight protein-tyrosine-phosphatase n=1 Tax=Pistricoccus aurantiacus TaxID=1883414 RepID=UPI0036361D0F
MRVLFVCLGNICRSPTAEGVLRHKLEAAGLADKVEVDSCGTSDWHLDQAPDPRAVEAASRRGVDIRQLRGRQISAEDFQYFDYILAMDDSNLANLEALQPANSRARLGLFLEFAGKPGEAIPDPYTGDDKGFEAVLDSVEQAADGLIATLRKRLEAV